MRITNSEWKSFWKAIGDDWYHDDDDVPEDAETAPWFNVTCGVLGFQGKQMPDKHPVLTATELDDGCADLIVVFRRWKRRQKFTTLVVEVDRERLDAVKTAVKKAGGRVHL